MVVWHNEWIAASEARFGFRDSEFWDEQNKILSDAVMSGALNSSRVGLILSQSLNTEVQTRAKLLLEQFCESLAALSTLTSHDMIDAELLAEDALKKTFEHLYHQSSIGRYANNNPLSKLKENNDSNVLETIKLLKIQIKNAGATAVNRHVEGASYVTNITIQGHGNAVQAGNYNSTIGLNFNSSTVQNLTTAFEDLSRVIANSDAPEVLKAELIDVTSDCRAEMTKPTPNRTKFIGLLNGLATSIQTVASLKDAWEIFKVGAVALGILIT